MGTTAEKLAYLNTTKQQLKTAINNKGGTLTDNDTFRDYVGAVNDIVTEQHTDYAGPYTVTENGTLPTAGKAMTENVVVNVSSSSDSLAEAWAAYKVENTTSWAGAFYCFSSGYYNVLRWLQKVDALDFSGSGNVTDMDSMFYLCSLLASVPLFDTSNVTNMQYMFYGCNALTTVPAFNTAKVTNMRSMFSGCKSLTSVPSFNTLNVTNMNQMFENCLSLTSIPAFDVSKVTTMSNIISYDTEVETIHMYGMKVNFSISASTKFTREALVEIINNCQDLTGGTARTLTMGSTNLAKLTADDIAIATAKNWTLA